MSAARIRADRKARHFPDHPFDVSAYLADIVCLAIEREHPASSLERPYRHWRADAVRRMTGCLDAGQSHHRGQA